MHKLTLEEKKALIFDIMKDIDRFCRENNIKYTISSGTLLGAVRHGGFIPWDDDADMFMLREDFDRFVKTYKSPKYHVLFNNRDKDEFFAAGYAKVSDPRTRGEYKNSKTSYGMYVDVFPLDAVPEDPREREKYMHRIMSIHNRLHHRQKKDIVSILKSYRHSLNWWWNRLDREVHSGTHADSPLVAHVVGTTNYRTVLPAKWFDSLKDIDFEGYKFLGFSDTHAYLSMVYGDDYMTPRQWSHEFTIYTKDASE